MPPRRRRPEDDSDDMSTSSSGSSDDLGDSSSDDSSADRRKKKKRYSSDDEYDPTRDNVAQATSYRKGTKRPSSSAFHHKEPSHSLQPTMAPAAHVMQHVARPPVRGPVQNLALAQVLLSPPHTQNHSFIVQYVPQMFVEQAAPQPLVLHTCRICGDTAAGRHLGVYSCEGCRKFYTRTIDQKRVYRCRGNGHCSVRIESRTQCRHCRFQKCLNEGMGPVEDWMRQSTADPNIIELSVDVSDAEVMSEKLEQSDQDETEALEIGSELPASPAPAPIASIRKSDFESKILEGLNSLVAPIVTLNMECETACEEIDDSDAEEQEKTAVREPCPEYEYGLRRTVFNDDLILICETVSEEADSSYSYPEELSMRQRNDYANKLKAYNTFSSILASRKTKLYKITELDLKTTGENMTQFKDRLRSEMRAATQTQSNHNQSASMT